MNRSKLSKVLLFVMAFAGAVPARGQAPSTMAVQAPIWIGKPDVAAFEKMENDHLAAGQAAIDQILAVKGARTIENTLVPYDEVIRQYNSAGYLAVLLQQVHPDAKFRDSATAMTSKVGAATSSLALNQGVYKALAAIDVT
ncbi:MAG TPA: hypothetical protein VFP96_02730, partial [Candidatus Acidoferrum sp.]|nr:hypothetical protein [Candidatus Acidoferrum sp.]